MRYSFYALLICSSCATMLAPEKVKLRMHASQPAKLMVAKDVIL